MIFFLLNSSSPPLSSPHPKPQAVKTSCWGFMWLTVLGYHSEDLLYKGSPPIPPFPGYRAPHWHLIPPQSQLKRENPQHVLTDTYIYIYIFFNTPTAGALAYGKLMSPSFQESPLGQGRPCSGRSCSSHTANSNEKSPQRDEVWHQAGPLLPTSISGSTCQGTSSRTPWRVKAI